MNKNQFRRIAGIGGILILVGMLLLNVSPAAAELKIVNVFYAWDEVGLDFQNSLLEVAWDGGYVPFLHQIAGPQSNELDFDSKHTVFVSRTLIALVGGTPTVFNVNTEFAGVMDYAVYHTDNNPVGAPGFTNTRRWSLVWCDRTGDGVFDTSGGAGSDLKGGNPFDYYIKNKIEDLPTVFVDQVSSAGCTTGNCQDELDTRLFVSLDKNNDGQIDAEYRVGGTISGAVRPVCFYAEAKKPLEAVPTWVGNPQARITAGGGDKTVNFHVNPGPSTTVVMDTVLGDPILGTALPGVAPFILTLGSSVVDFITITPQGTGSINGTLSTYVCQSTSLTPCASGGVLVGTQSVNAPGFTTVQSAEYIFPAEGYYCFRNEFTPSGSATVIHIGGNANTLTECAHVTRSTAVTLSSFEATSDRQGLNVLLLGMLGLVGVFGIWRINQRA